VHSLEQIKTDIEAAVPGAQVEIVPNDSPSGQRSLLLGPGQALAIAAFLRDDPELRLDYLSNVTGVDWLDQTTKEKVRIRALVDGVEKELEDTVERKRPGYLEAVYHLYSVAHKHGPVILRLRTRDRTTQVQLPSLTPIWRSAEFQEREIYDLYGIDFQGHPDLRRLLLWDGFQDHPMRRDYVEPDDYEWEPTPHDDIVQKARSRASEEVKR
jgi:NADH-quinone oxidoreductase subunit C